MYRNCNLNNNDCMPNDMLVNNPNNDYDSFFNNNSSPCACGFNNPGILPDPLLYASSYVPHQYMNTIFNTQNGLKMGTIFPELSQGYCPGQSREIFDILSKSNNQEGGCM